MARVDMEVRSFIAESIKIETRDDKSRIIVGHSAVFGKLSEDFGGYREQIQAGAFADSIKNDDVVALFNHDPNLVLGRKSAKTLRMSEDETGLSVEIAPPDTQMARDLMTSIDRGDIRGMSIGFNINPGGSTWMENAAGMVIRTLTSVRLYDVSPVTFPAYPQTDVALRSLAEYRKSLPKNDAQWHINLLKRYLECDILA